MKPITFQTKIYEILEEYPQLEDTLMQLSPAFAKLKNPILRKTIARVTSLEQAAAIAGIEAGEMVQKLRVAAGLGALEPQSGVWNQIPAEQPEWFSEAMVKERFHATAMIESGQVPMSLILSKAKTLSKGEILEFSTPFLPVPILELLSSKGFGVWSKKPELEGEPYHNFTTPL